MQVQAALVQWLLHESRAAASPAELLHQLCLRLNRQGMEITRANVVIRALHPQVEVIAYVWRRGAHALEDIPEARHNLASRAHHAFAGGTVDERAILHGEAHLKLLRTSPFQRIFDGAERVRIRPHEEGVEQYEITKTLRAEGATDYVCLPLKLRRPEVHAVSFATVRAGGFSPIDLEALDELAPVLALALESFVGDQIARAILSTYLGAEAGPRVLAGRIHRGDVERIDAVLWFSDLRGFTETSQQLDPETLVRWLNRYYAVVLPAIRDGGGQTLKLIGDAVLAIFPFSDDSSKSDACRRAIDAALRATLELDELAASPDPELPSIRHGVALHAGEVQYGNIGDALRLDFTVIGPAVNLASRLEGLCSKVDQPLVVSEAVAERVDRPWVDLGSFELKGVEAPTRVFAPGS